MVAVTIIAVGKLKEKFYRDAAAEYEKRLSRFCKLNILELKDEPTPDTPTEKERDAVLEKEGARILSKIPDSAYVIALCVEGSQRPSEKFAQLLEQAEIEGRGHIVFVIGGSLGLSAQVKNRANLRLSFSEMTFPHQLMRVILLEQIYRGFQIRTGTQYHK
uniref:Ribosomal RNA large subunit methyltransferase H n=1 Tax=uncultured Bacillota bacterium TaxID=344338 RepID=A0A650EN76_9FIRM|nr:ribosomal RNA large subunit methyltransferase H [uncultured Firmicutes bacterium]